MAKIMQKYFLNYVPVGPMKICQLTVKTEFICA
jgi:hypothetical protein